MAINSDIAMLLSEIDANLSHAESITHGLSNTQFNWQPEPGRWSIAQCLAHLNIVNGRDLPFLEAAIKSGHERNITAEGPFTYGLLARKFIASQEPPVKRKFKAPKVYIPPPDAELKETLREYRQTSGKLRSLTQSAKGLDLARVRCYMPALPAILRPFLKIALGARLNLICTHDRRHLWQAEQVRQDPRFPQT
jgi:hypothetical protein